MNQKLKELHKKSLLIEKELQKNFLSKENRDSFCKSLEICGVEKLKNLSIRVKTGMNLSQFMCFIVPIERELNKKITDSEILIEKEDFYRKKKENNKLIIVLDNIRSPFNMGAIVRTCDALGVCELVVTGYTPEIDNERVKKTSMGAWKNINFKRFRMLEDVIGYLKNKKYEVAAVETASKALNLHDAKLPPNTALVFGNERFGISEADLKYCDKVVRLPMYGVKNSLNVNAALTACGYEWVRQNGEF